MHLVDCCTCQFLTLQFFGELGFKKQKSNEVRQYDFMHGKFVCYKFRLPSSVLNQIMTIIWKENEASLRAWCCRGYHCRYCIPMILQVLRLKGNFYRNRVRRTWVPADIGYSLLYNLYQIQRGLVCLSTGYSTVRHWDTPLAYQKHPTRLQRIQRGNNHRNTCNTSQPLLVKKQKVLILCSCRLSLTFSKLK